MTVIDFEEKRLEKLSAEELSRHVMRFPVKRRMELILSRHDADAVVKAMPEQDFYYSVQEIGPEDSLPLLAMARVEQLEYLFDLEWWQKDRIAAAKALGWIEKLSRTGEEQLLSWLYKVDFELLVALFKQWIRADVVPEETDPMEAAERLPKNTLDDLYYWEASYPQYEDLLRLILSLLFEVHQGFYKELLNHTIWGAQTEIEEDAYRFHRARLEDFAVPDYYEAMEIYRAISEKELTPGKESALRVSEEAQPPSFALALVSADDLLGLALGEIEDPALIDLLQLELASLSNKVVVADQLPPDSPD
ncbi:MAG: DUF6178 family protein, partial [Acidobacteriota bacterium]